MTLLPKKSFVAASLMSVAVIAPSAFAQVGYYRQPAIHDDTVVFVAEGDLWRVSGAGGVAQRLTTNLAEESLPRISADGKLVAFTARYEGPAEVYVMPITGGLPTRLTHEGDNARVQGFQRDGRILYTSARWSGRPEQRMYAIDPVTRVSQPIPLSEAAEGCYMGADFIFARLPAGSDNVKNYRGGLTQKIWRFDGKSEAVNLTGGYEGSSRQPMCGSGASAGRVFFLSDRDGTMNLWSMTNAGGELKQHTRHQGFDIRSANIASDGTRIVYQRGADIHVFEVASGTDRVLSVTLQSDFEHVRTRWVKNPWDFVTAIEPSPTGDRVAVTARGEVFVLPVGNGRRVELLRNAAVRARNAAFSADGRSVFAFADQSGEFELTKYPANGVGAATTLTTEAKVLRLGLRVSPDGKLVIHHDKLRKLYLTDTASGKTREVDRSAFGEYGNLNWSPDSRYVVYSKRASNQFDPMWLLDVSTGALTQLTSDRYDVRDAAFSPDGKWLYFLSNRNLQSLVTSPWGQRNPEPYFDRQTRIYAYALDPVARWPFMPRNELQMPDVPKSALEVAADARPPATAAATPSIPVAKVPEPRIAALVLDGIRERMFEVPIAAGNYSDLSTDGKRLYFVVSDPAERKQSLRSVAIEAPNPTPPAVDLFIEDIRAYQLTQDRKKLMVRKVNDVFLFDVGRAAPPVPEQGKFAVNTRDWMIEIDPRREWQQMFNDAWRMHRDFFYDTNMHGADWKTARARFQPLLDRATDRAEVNDVIAQMISEVRALHSQTNAGDIRKGVDTIDVAALGADFVKTAEGFRVERIFGGDPELIEEKSPLAKAEVGVRVGDVITAINGVAVAGAATIGELLRNQVDKQVLLSVMASGKRRDVVVTPVTLQRDRELRYLAWEREREERTTKLSNGKIGYVHLQAMGGPDVARWAREFYPVYQREGLIIDLRRNNGGSIDSWILEKLQRRVWHFWQSRRTDDNYWNQQLAFRGHVVALIDAETYSDGETMAQGLRRLGIAPLIGKTTAGAGIWLSDQNRLRDNGIARAAENGVFVDNKGERQWITEGIGVKPDIDVDNPPYATYKGEDAQLARAIAYLNEKIAKEPIPTITAPEFLVKVPK